MLLPKTIFVIDDDPGMLRTIERLLKVYCFDVRTFTSAEVFLDTANARDVGCLVLDVHLGGMTGIELSRQLALSGISVPVIFITANDNDVIRKAAREVGCIAYLPKPFPAKQLINAIETALNGLSDGLQRA